MSGRFCSVCAKAFTFTPTASRTPGGHWRFNRKDVEAFLPPEPEPAK